MTGLSLLFRPMLALGYHYRGTFNNTVLIVIDGKICSVIDYVL